ncbi:deoxyribose-phosphate aldolase-like isoform X2 [Limulus polyphemus]|uniref:deoxyribose-phosphate aldolase n=1 Tax=Limulus polyphemus TaxID=6850 RepID=A0ABM1SD33_LIMPO|nr:deoxyribose-phosphate aldolase-like isoform X2 [Limulus polyphemus]
MAARNPGSVLDLDWVQRININLSAVKRRAEAIPTRRAVKKECQAAWLLKAISCIDLTTLSGDDTFTNVQRLCHKAVHPVRQDLCDAMDIDQKGLTVAAVCVYPARVADSVKSLKFLGAKIPVAAVATGFPTGQYSLETRLEEIKRAVADGAQEIDIVINRNYALGGNWEGIYREVQMMKEACGSAHMKTILATGELGTMTNVYKASIVCMMAGADFIKTSTGKETVNATLPVGLVMTRAIRDYYQITGYKVDLHLSNI